VPAPERVKTPQKSINSMVFDLLFWGKCTPFIDNVNLILYNYFRKLRRWLAFRRRRTYSAKLIFQGG
jgi:hypothetical protein